MQLAALIYDGFRESLDRKIFWVLVALTVLVTLTMVSVGFDGDRITFLFGMWSAETERYNPLTDIGRSRLVGAVVYLLASSLVGGIGVLLMIIATASSIPTFMERGTIDVVLAKPISRPRLFLYKYLSGLVFVTIQAGVFVGLTFLVMGLRWGIWRPGYLLTIPLLVLLFSYLYCVSAFVAVRTQSAVAAILLSVFAWIMFALIHQAPSLFEVFPELKERRALYQAVRVVSWIPPKTGDFPYLAARWSGAGTSLDALPVSALDAQTPEDKRDLARAQRIEERELQKSPVYSVGSSLLFEAVVVLWAMWIFSRKDF